MYLIIKQLHKNSNDRFFKLLINCLLSSLRYNADDFPSSEKGLTLRLFLVLKYSILSSLKLI